MSQTTDLTALSYWFPKIQEAGLPVPKTVLLTMSAEAEKQTFGFFDGEEIGVEARKFFLNLADAAETRIGFPCFLRTGHSSAKHEWARTCYVPSKADVAEHAMNIIYFSECQGIIGMPWREWAIRELLPTKPVAFAPGYDEMPVNREFRFFVDGPAIECWHPYWPEEALARGGINPIIIARTLDALAMKPEELPALTLLASRVGAAVGGRWSVDLLETERGWYVTDMAEADKSWHWPDCEIQERHLTDAGESGT